MSPMLYQRLLETMNNEELEDEWQLRLAAKPINAFSASDLCYTEMRSRGLLDSVEEEEDAS